MKTRPKLNAYASIDKSKLTHFQSLLKEYIDAHSSKTPPFTKLELINIKNYLLDLELELNSCNNQIDKDTKRLNKFIRKRLRGNDDKLSDSEAEEDEINNENDDEDKENADSGESKPGLEDKKSKRSRTTIVKIEEDLLKPPIPIVKEETPDLELRTSSRLRSRSSRNTPTLEPELLPPSVKEKIKASPRRNNKNKSSKLLSNRPTPSSEASNLETAELPRSPMPPKAPRVSLEAIKTKIQEVIQLKPLPPPPPGVQCKSKLSDALLQIEEDFTKQNSTNQIAITTFYHWLEPYLKNITEDDLKVLQTQNDIEPYLTIPPVGKHYKERWNEKDRKLSVSSKDGSILAPDQPSTSLAGPFATRLFAALLQEQIDMPPPPEDDTEDEGTETNQNQSASTPSAPTIFDNDFEKRVRRELLFLGLIQEEDVDKPEESDDNPVVSELKRLQKELRDQVRVNQQRKHRLLQIAQEHIAYQEYSAILDELDKTVEQCYVKRVKSLRAKKKKTAALRPLSEPTIAALDRRQRFLAALAPLFNKENYNLPKESVYKDIVMNDLGDEDHSRSN